MDLLTLANAVSSNLHNINRSNKPSYAPGTSYGTNIPGTSINKGQGLENLENKGRKGDNKIRKVQGRPSHVNSVEASVIDHFGPLGEAWVKNIGSGSINPKTGMPEYFFKKIFKKAKKWTEDKLGINWGTWRPADGQFGPWGTTEEHKEREKLKEQTNQRMDDYADFRDKYENQNILV